MKKYNSKIIIIFLIIISLTFITKLVLFYSSKDDINIILKSSSYSYLPKKAQNYIKQKYEETGKILYTEKNKKTNTPYLNPNFVNYLLLSDKEKSEESVIPMPTIVDYIKIDTISSSSLPSEYDLRNVDGKNFVSPVRDQGNLNLCWAFSTAGITESHLLKTFDKSYDQTSELISERQIDYATSVNGINDYDSEYVSFIKRKLGDGGNFYISTIAMANGISLVNYNNFKAYNDADLSKMELNEILNYNKSLYELNSTIILPILNVRKFTGNPTTSSLEVRENYINNVKQSIMTYGASYVSTYMSQGCGYKSYEGDLVIDNYNCSYTNSHAMEIIGWNDNFNYSYCADTSYHTKDLTNCNNIVNGSGAWILKNSWGSSYPYLYLVYDSANTEINFITEMESTNNKNWDNNYIVGSIGTTSVRTATELLSTTKIKNTEKLKKIKFINSVSNDTITIKILKTDGTYETIQKNTGLPGLVTIDVTSDILINKDSKITIASSGFYDDVSIFTSNIDTTPTISLDHYNNISITDKNILLYSETKNIPSNSIITYKLFDENNKEISTEITTKNNIVAENNINTSLTFLESLDSGIYKLEAIYNNVVISTININYLPLQGSGTSSDPYIITNPTQLSQIKNDLDGYYIIEKDIDLTTSTREGGKFYNQSDEALANNLGGTGWIPITNFSGTLDGQGHSIKGLFEKTYLSSTIKRTDGNGGLFGTLLKNATIKNLILEDFDITCHNHCGILASDYNNDTTDILGYNVNVSNIGITNSKVNTIHDNDVAYSGGLIGYMYGNDNTIFNISNIYFDSKVESYDILGGLSAKINKFKQLNINNIEMLGNIIPKNNDGSDAGVLSQEIIGNNISIENIISTVNNEKNSGLLGNIINGTTTINNTNLLKIGDKNYFNNININATNSNKYTLSLDSNQLKNSNSYLTWTNFNNNWIIKTIDNISRLPILNFMSNKFEFTKINDIEISLTDNNANIYDYVTPNTEAAKRIVYKVADESIISIDTSGKITPLKPGNTTIHVESLYDGYEKDIQVTINYPNSYYIIKYDANGGIGNMERSILNLGIENQLKNNLFVRQYYDFINWNTYADGTGDSYSNEEVINLNVTNGTTLILYAQWRGIKSLITFDSYGGSVPINTKEVYYKEPVGELPIPIKIGYGFMGWNYEEQNLDSDFKAYPTNITVKAVWKENAYTIVFNPNAGNGLKYYTYALNNSDKKLLNNKFTKEHYIFNGWNTHADGSGTSLSETEIINKNNIENSLLNLYAQWTPEKYLIEYNSNEGTGNMSNQEISYNEIKCLNKNTFTKDGYNFIGWNTKADGTGIKYTNEQLITINNNLILYAIWEKVVPYIIKNYTYDISLNIIDGILINTTINNYKNNIQLGNGYEMQIITPYSVINTGSKTKIYHNNNLIKEFINIVRGDVNGDSKITSADYIKIKKHIMSTGIINDEVIIKAADVTLDNKITSADYVKIRKYIMNGG